MHPHQWLGVMGKLWLMRKNYPKTTISSKSWNEGKKIYIDIYVNWNIPEANWWQVDNLHLQLYSKNLPIWNACTPSQQNHNVIGKRTHVKEIRLLHCPEKYNCHYCLIGPQNYSSCKNLLQLPTVWQRRRFNSIFGDGHNCSWLEEEGKRRKKVIFVSTRRQIMLG